MEIVKTNDFERAFNKLPKEIQRLYSIQEERFKENWRDPRLHIKKVSTLPYALSFRITRRYRVFFIFKIQKQQYSLKLTIGRRFIDKAYL